MGLFARVRCPRRNDRRFAPRSRLFNYQVETAPTQRIAQPTFLVRSEEYVRNRGWANGTQSRNRKRPGREQLQQDRFEGVAHFVNLVDQEHTGLLLLDG